MTTWQPEERHIVVLRALGSDWRVLGEVRDVSEPRLASLRSVLGRLVKLRAEGYVAYRLESGAGQWTITDKGRAHV